MTVNFWYFSYVSWHTFTLSYLRFQIKSEELYCHSCNKAIQNKWILNFRLLLHWYLNRFAVLNKLFHIFENYDYLNQVLHDIDTYFDRWKTNIRVCVVVSELLFGPEKFSMTQTVNLTCNLPSLFSIAILPYSWS